MHISCISQLSLFVIFLLSGCSAHVSLSPNSGVALGSYTTLTAKIPHAEHGYFTTRVELTIPHGVLSVTPQVNDGWTISLETRDLGADSFTSHGNLVTTVVSKVIWTAEHPDEALSHAHLDTFSVQVQLGCRFNDTNTNTFWNNAYALWFPCEQRLSPSGELTHSNTLSWTGVVEGDSLWSDGQPRPSPYAIIGDWSACESSGGFQWFNNIIPVSTLSLSDLLVNELRLQAFVQEGLDSILSTSRQELDQVHQALLDCVVALERQQSSDDSSYSAVEITALVFGCMAFVLATVSIVFLAVALRRSRAELASVPLVRPSNDGNQPVTDI